MGVCQECRVTVDGRPDQRACMTAVRDGMEVATDAL
jgi:sarcosine oxidase subunit alpha